MNGARYWFVVLLLVAVIAMAGLPHAIGREYSLSGAVYHGNEPDTGLTDLWLATLSKQPTLKVLERADIRSILGELSLAGVNDDAARQVRLGRLLGVEYFAWIRAADEQALLEVVEAATGRGIKVVPMAFAKGKFAETLPTLAEQAAQAVSQFLPVQTQAVASLAFAIPRISVSNDTVRAAVEKIIADLSGNLSDAGITVLPRRFAADAVQERWRQDKGLVEDATKGREFLGADYIIGAAVDASNRMELVMVETSTGRRVGRKEIALAEAQMADGLKALNQWGMDRLKPTAERPYAFPFTGITKGRYGAPELLKSLYAGMVLHNQGRYIDAITWFEDAKQRKLRMDEIEAWIDNCYRLAGFPEVADEVPNVSSVAPVYKKPSPTLNAQSEPGVVLLGVTSDTKMPGGLAERMGILLIDCLHKVTETPVLAAEDIAELRDEYDLLLGLDKVKGTTWQKAPPLLLREAVSAHLEPDKEGLYLRLCLIRNYNPTSIYNAVTKLPADYTQWRSQIDKAAKELLACSAQETPTWKPPALKIAEEQRQLLYQLDMSFTPWIYLKALSRNPELTNYRSKAPWRVGLERWFLRVLPEGHTDRPFLEFSVLTLPFKTGRYPSSATLQKFRVESERIANSYPEHIVGLLSKYNLAIMDMTAENLVETQKKISRLISQLICFQDKYPIPVTAIVRLDADLRYALGLSDSKADDPDYFKHCYGGFIGVEDNYPLDRPFGGGKVMGYVTLKGDYFHPRTPEQMRIDFEALCLLRDHGTIPSSFLRDIVEKKGRDSDLARYAVVKYFRVMMSTFQDGLVSNKKWAEEDLFVIYPVFAESLQNLLEREPKSIPKHWAESATQKHHHYPDNPVLNNYLRKAQLAVEKAFPSPSAEQRRKLFDESWKVGPLEDSAWLDYSCNYIGTNVFELYYPYLERLHELYDDVVKSPEICRLYGQFGIVFFRAGRYDLAEPLFEQIISWRDYKNRPPESQIHALSLYLLALLKQRNGDNPSAVRLAREAIEFMDNHPQVYFRLYNRIHTNGMKAGWENITAGGLAGDLKARVATFAKELRENPNMTFKSPYPN